MHRRTLLKGTATAATGTLAALAGCSSGASGEVVTNELDSIDVKSHRLENRTIRGTEAVDCIVTVENTGDQAVGIAMNVELYNGDTIVAADDATVDEIIQPGTKKEISEAHEGRKGDVTRYEISITEQSFVF